MKNKTLYIAIIIVVIVGFGIGGYFFWKKFGKKKDDPNIRTFDPTNNTPVSDCPCGKTDGDCDCVKKLPSDLSNTSENEPEMELPDETIPAPTFLPNTSENVPQLQILPTMTKTRLGNLNLTEVARQNA